MIKAVFEDFSDREEKVSINISTEDIFNKDIANKIIKELESYENSHNIILEITESGSIKDYDLLNTFIKQVFNKGSSISLDDFGTEYSNLSHISNIDTQYLKIDGHFIKDCHINNKNYEIVKSIVDFCKKLNIETIAEFVETEEIYQLVKKIGVDYSQGHYFGEAQPLNKIKRRT